MTRPAARVSDNGTPGHLPPKISPGIGCLKVLIGKRPAWRANVDRHICMTPIAPPAPAPHGPETCFMGSFTVLVDNQMAVRVGDILTGAGPPNPIMMGETTVLIGDIAFGLAAQANICDFCADFKDLMAKWPSMTPDERKEALEKIINKQLGKSGTPPVGVNPSNLGAGTNGQLDFQKWNLDINNNLLSSNTLTKTQSSGLANTLYHEARHAEQWFAMAQSRAGAGVGAAQISSGMQIPSSVANAAAARPLPPNSSPQAVFGQTMNQSVYSPTQGAYRNNVLNNLNNSSAPPHTYDQYRALPEERDAWDTGDATGGCA